MSESELRDSLAAAILATPGVLRIEPTFQRSVRSLVANPGGLTVLQRSSPAGPVTQVSVDLAAANGAPARETAHRVREVIVACLELSGRVAGAVTVNVLSIEAAESKSG